jgi:hypothetical protein
VLLLFVRITIGVGVGLAVAAAYWAAAMIFGGHEIVEAMRGQVEDGLGVLQGMATLGALCCAGVGLGCGLLAVNKGRA